MTRRTGIKVEFLTDGRAVTLDRYGESGPYKVLAQHFGFTAENVVAKAREIL